MKETLISAKRKEIELMDIQILAALDARLALAKDIGQIKKALKLEHVDPDAEESTKKRYRNGLAKKWQLPELEVEKLAAVVIQLSRWVQVQDDE
jgi:chorismate mutase